MSEIYTFEEVKRAIEFIESVLQGMDEMIGSGKYTVEEVNILYQRRTQTLTVLNQWKSRLVEGDNKKGKNDER